MISGILQKDKLAESLPVYRDSVKTFLWGIDTKYYTADVHLCIVEKEQFGNGEVLENLQALVVHFDNMKVSGISSSMYCALIVWYYIKHIITSLMRS